jgi:hypothetical protein
MIAHLYSVVIIPTYSKERLPSFFSRYSGVLRAIISQKNQNAIKNRVGYFYPENTNPVSVDDLINLFIVIYSDTKLCASNILQTFLLMVV